MAVFVLTPETVWNPKAFKIKSAPRKLVGRMPILPKPDAGWALMTRAILDRDVLRYMLALLPFVVAAIAFPNTALPISQAPLFMLLVVGIIELRVLRVPRSRRARVTTEDAAARTLDALGFRARGVLSKIAASRGATLGEFYLVIDQSDLSISPALTVVSVQTEHETTRILSLSPAEREIIETDLFDADLTDHDLLLANLRDNTFMRSFAFDARGVTAHARLAAILEGPAPDGAPA